MASRGPSLVVQEADWSRSQAIEHRVRRGRSVKSIRFAFDSTYALIYATIA